MQLFKKKTAKTAKNIYEAVVVTNTINAHNMFLLTAASPLLSLAYKSHSVIFWVKLTAGIKIVLALYLFQLINGGHPTSLAL